MICHETRSSAKAACASVQAFKTDLVSIILRRWQGRQVVERTAWPESHVDHLLSDRHEELTCRHGSELSRLREVTGRAILRIAAGLFARRCADPEVEALAQDINPAMIATRSMTRVRAIVLALTFLRPWNGNRPG